jgi:hypothetical protein
MLLSSTSLSTSKHYADTTVVGSRVELSTSGTSCYASSRATRTATSFLRHGRDRTSSPRSLSLALTSSRPLTAKSSPMPRISSSYIDSTLRFFLSCWYTYAKNQVSEIKGILLVRVIINPSVFSDVRPLRRPGVRPHSGADSGILIFRNFLLHPTPFL